MTAKRKTPRSKPMRRLEISADGRKLKIGGLNVNVVSEEEADQAEMVVCMPEGSFTPFTDNLTGPCAVCGTTVIFRPTAPKRPQKVCIHCAIPLAAPAAGHA